MNTVEWTSSVGVLKEQENLVAVSVDNTTFNNVVAGKWIQDDLYQLLRENNFKLLLQSEDGRQAAIRTFGTKFALFTGLVKYT